MKLVRTADARPERSAATRPRTSGRCGISISTMDRRRCLLPDGQWLRPIALGILDDHSRLCCHVQWYLSETAEDLVHGLSQAIQKRGLPRALLTDNGSAMVAEEVTEGLLRLGVVHERTLPYSPYQNGKQEAFWGRLEGRLMKARGRDRVDTRASRSDPGVGGMSTTWRYTARLPARRSSGSLVHRTCSARAPRASRFATRFAWRPTGVNVKAMERSRSKACA